MYRSLAHATGGEFLAVGSGGFDASGADVARFLSALRGPEQDSERAGSQSRLLLADERARRQMKYEEDVRAGRADAFDWHVALPPPRRDT